MSVNILVNFQGFMNFWNLTALSLSLSLVVFQVWNFPVVSFFLVFATPPQHSHPGTTTTLQGQEFQQTMRHTSLWGCQYCLHLGQLIWRCILERTWSIIEYGGFVSFPVVTRTKCWSLSTSQPKGKKKKDFFISKFWRQKVQNSGNWLVSVKGLLVDGRMMSEWRRDHMVRKETRESQGSGVRGQVCFLLSEQKPLVRVMPSVTGLLHFQ